MHAAVAPANMVARVEKAQMVHRSFAYVDQDIEEINVRLLPTHADQILVYMGDYVLALNQATSVVVLMVVTDDTVNVLHLDSKNYLIWPFLRLMLLLTISQ